MNMMDLMQSLEMGQKSCRLVVRKGDERGELYFASGQCRDAKIGNIEGDDAVYQGSSLDGRRIRDRFQRRRTNPHVRATTRNTTGLLMEAMRLMDEASRDEVPATKS